MQGSQQVRRPLVGIALSLVLGFLVQIGFSWPPLLALGFLSGGLAWACCTLSRRSSRSIYFVCALLAIAYGAIERVPYPSQSVLPVLEMEDDRQEMVGTIQNDPTFSSSDGTSSFRFQVEAVRLGEEWRPADSTVRVVVKTPRSVGRYGERWQLEGRYRQYGKRYSGIGGAFYVGESGADRLREAPFSLKGFCYQMRRRAVPVFQDEMGTFPEYSRVMNAMLLGIRKALSPELYQTFSLTGTLHIFAISGLHVGVMAAILIAILKLIGISKPRWGIFLIPLLFFYVVSTGMKPSAFRAFTMASIYFAAPLVRRRPDAATAIALSAILLLGLNPLQLTDPGFLLSFIVVSGIVMAHSYMGWRFGGFRRPLWAVPLAQRRGPTTLMAALRAVGLIMLTSVAAWVFSAPLTAYFFNTLSPVALMANLAIIPLTFMIVLTGCLTLLTAPLCVSLMAVFHDANHLFTGGIVAIIQQLKMCPGAYFFVRSPSVTSMVCWYIGLSVGLIGPRRSRWIGGGLLVTAILLWWTGPVADRGQGVAEVWRAHGSSVAFRLPEDRWVVLAEKQSAGRTMQRLKKEGINHLYALVVNGVEEIQPWCETFSVQQIWVPQTFQGQPGFDAFAQTDPILYFFDRPRWAVGDGFISFEVGPNRLSGYPAKRMKFRADQPVP